MIWVLARKKDREFAKAQGWERDAKTPVEDGKKKKGKAVLGNQKRY